MKHEDVFHACTMHGTWTMTCNVLSCFVKLNKHLTLIIHACSFNVPCTKHACCMHRVCMSHALNQLYTCMLHACTMHAYILWALHPLFWSHLVLLQSTLNLTDIDKAEKLLHHHFYFKFSTYYRTNETFFFSILKCHYCLCNYT